MTSTTIEELDARIEKRGKAIEELEQKQAALESGMDKLNAQRSELMKERDAAQAKQWGEYAIFTGSAPRIPGIPTGAIVSIDGIETLHFGVMATVRYDSGGILHIKRVVPLDELIQADDAEAAGKVRDKQIAYHREQIAKLEFEESEA